LSRLICPKCEESGLTWQDVDQIDLLENGIMICDNPNCKAAFKGIQGWKDNKQIN